MGGGSFPLEGDGCVPGLYHYLRAKNEFNRSCPGVHVPDTVVYKYRQPAYWYFTSREAEGQIKMKNKVNLGNAKVEECFTGRRDQMCEAVGYYIATQDSNSHKPITTLEHFDSDGLRDFLYFRDKENNGILQRFIEPKGSHNAIIRAIWSPSIFIAERRVNITPLPETKVSFHRRVATFEGPDHFSELIGVTTTRTGQQVQALCHNIVRHVQQVSDGNAKIGRLVLHFKVDKNDRIWLLWCSSLRMVSEDVLREPSAPMRLQHEITVPSHVKRVLDGPKPSMAAQGKKSMSQCPMCLKSVTTRQRCECTYKMVIDYIEVCSDRAFREAESRGDQAALAAIVHDDDEVPVILRRLHPNLTMENYEILRRDPLFQYSRLTVCDACFLNMTENIYPKLPVINPPAAPSFARPNSVSALDFSSMGTTDGATAGPGRSRSQASFMDAQVRRPRRKTQASPSKAAVHKPRPKSKTGSRPGSKTGDRAGEDKVPYKGSLAPFRATRLAENYVTAVSKQTWIKQIEAKLVGNPLPLPPLPSSAATQQTPDESMPVHTRTVQAGAVDDLANAALEASSGMAPAAAKTLISKGLEGGDDPTQTAFALSVLESEETLLRAAQNAGIQPLKASHSSSSLPPRPFGSDIPMGEMPGKNFSTYGPGQATPFEFSPVRTASSPSSPPRGSRGKDGSGSAQKNRPTRKTPGKGTRVQDESPPQGHTSEGQAAEAPAKEEQASSSSGAIQEDASEPISAAGADSGERGQESEPVEKEQAPQEGPSAGNADDGGAAEHEASA